jgi:cell division septation protein DedD
MRKILQQRFLGFFVLVLLFVGTMAYLLITVKQHPVPSLLTSMTLDLPPTHDDALEAAESQVSDDPLDALAVVAMMAEESPGSMGAPEVFLDVPQTSAPLVISAKPQTAPVQSHVEWLVQAAAFSSKNNAERLKERLEQAGWSAFVKSKRISAAKVHYRLFVGPFDSEAKANSAQEKINHQFHVLGFVVKDSV